jgi:hypothetical protein
MLRRVARLKNRRLGGTERRDHEGVGYWCPI